ncbi:MAG: helicase C-terminal domain-containing protein [Nanoarchaeota archaeon]
MGKLLFDINGKPIRQGNIRNLNLQDYSIGKNKLHEAGVENSQEESSEKTILKTSASLEFLKDEPETIANDNNPHDNSDNNLTSAVNVNNSSSMYWSLFSDDKLLPPLKFTNGKTQEDVVREVVELTKKHKVIFIHGTCGSGKSAIALNIARVLGKASIVVPVKALQKQYEEDYITKKYLRKNDGKKMKIAMITGRDNHDSIISPGLSCADPSLPENIKITEKNYGKIMDYVRQNPFLSHLSNLTLPLEDVRRFTIAAANPYWSPILPAEFEFKALTDAKRIRYMGVDRKEHIFYHRKNGCSYYDQYLAYVNADVAIFNAAKYKAEMSLGRKPLTEIDIIDEADEFLDEFFQQDELNLTRLLASAKGFYPDSNLAKHSLDKIKKWIELEEQNKRATGVREEDVFKISDTNIGEILLELILILDLESEITLDELNYLNKAVETAHVFENSLDSLYLTYRKNEEGNLMARLVSTDISGKFKDLLSKTKVLILMSGTLHSDNIIKNIFEIGDFKVVHAEELNFGSTEIIATGKEFDCKYSNFTTNKHSREDYLMALSKCIEKAPMPVLVHVNAFKDLPSEEETRQFGLAGLDSAEKIKADQREDKEGALVSKFKKGQIKVLFTTKCTRGIDFPGEMCNSVVFTKYPNPNVADTFWKVLQKTHPDYYWEFYKDKAWRGFLQRIYRALRSPYDHVNILSPDIRVLQQVKKLQMQEGFSKNQDRII